MVFRLHYERSSLRPPTLSLSVTQCGCTRLDLDLTNATPPGEDTTAEWTALIPTPPPARRWSLFPAMYAGVGCVVSGVCVPSYCAWKHTSPLAEQRLLYRKTSHGTRPRASWDASNWERSPRSCVWINTLVAEGSWLLLPASVCGCLFARADYGRQCATRTHCIESRIYSTSSVRGLVLALHM